MATGEAALFSYIWITRSHYCEWCQTYLGPRPNVNFFHHLKTKGAHPELRLDPQNITLICANCHRGFHNGTIQEPNPEASNQRTPASAQLHNIVDGDKPVRDNPFE